MTEENIQCAIDARGIAMVTLNRPDKHNAFDDSMIAELTSAFEKLSNSKKVRAVVLAATGESFSAGGDLGWMKRMAEYSDDENFADATALAEMLRTLNELNKPTIARVQGAAFGGAVGLVACCDMAFAIPQASFSLSEVRIGLVPATISPYVIEAIGQHAARRYFVTGESFGAEIAQKLGLVSEIVGEEMLDDAIEGLLDMLLANAPGAIAIAKGLVRKVASRPVDDELVRYTSEVIATRRVSEEGQEGLTAFLEKRSPRWVEKD